MTLIETIKSNSRPASEVPGDNLRELTACLIDVLGDNVPEGTTFRVLSSGYDNIRRCSIAVLSTTQYGLITIIEDES